ncbi:cilia- and flagella-associated protein 69 [Ooceraea biroi]|uniref:cilia- and flagella-associated protein 69 n=1 Tax=Ooceraea biroi TaxID=2015173 RepID=UPI00097162A3|nr:cilia- and flagella-associated protein 69 [Ooceraea biroi]
MRRMYLDSWISDLSDNVLALEKLTMRRQRILTLLLTALESLLKKQTYVQQMYGERGVKIVTGIFVKCLYQKNEDSQVDQRLLLATGCYVWECIARCPNNLQIFLKAGGLYSMLDIIETTGYPVRCLYLGALTDMCDCTFCGPFLCTWRGADKKTGLMSLLASVWRQEEDRLGIKRRANGCIADPELPQMSTHQWTDTYRSKFTADVSPTIVDMLGSLQSKIFSILKIIERDEDKYEAVAEHYKILLNNLPTEDRITLCCVDMYLRLKLGQMWTELSRYLMQAGIAPLIVDAQLIAHMVQWHRSWGIFIEERQKKLVADAKRAEAFLEMEEFVRIRDSKLAPTLEALGEVEHIRRTTDRSYMLHKKDCQRRQVNAALSFPQDADVERCHRTFSDKTNVTVVFGQHQSIDSSHLKDLTCDLMELLPVSPPDSSSEKTFPVLDASGASGDTLLREDLFTDEYLIECLNR